MLLLPCFVGSNLTNTRDRTEPITILDAVIATAIIQDNANVEATTKHSPTDNIACQSSANRKRPYQAYFEDVADKDDVPPPPDKESALRPIMPKSDINSRNGLDSRPWSQSPSGSNLSDSYTIPKRSRPVHRSSEQNRNYEFWSKYPPRAS
jgi:hypothetical protein